MKTSKTGTKTKHLVKIEYKLFTLTTTHISVLQSRRATAWVIHSHQGQRRRLIILEESCLLSWFEEWGGTFLRRLRTVFHADVTCLAVAAFEWFEAYQMHCSSSLCQRDDGRLPGRGFARDSSFFSCFSRSNRRLDFFLKRFVCCWLATWQFRRHTRQFVRAQQVSGRLSTAWTPTALFVISIALPTGQRWTTIAPLQRSCTFRRAVRSWRGRRRRRQRFQCRRALFCGAWSSFTSTKSRWALPALGPRHPGGVVLHFRCTSWLRFRVKSDAEIAVAMDVVADQGGLIFHVTLQSIRFYGIDSLTWKRKLTRIKAQKSIACFPWQKRIPSKKSMVELEACVRATPRLDKKWIWRFLFQTAYAASRTFYFGA